MVCNADKFILNKNVGNEFLITIKQNASTLPMEITVTDTFTPTLINLETGATVTIGITTTTYNALGGIIKLVFNTTDVNALIAARGAKVDRYYLKPVYKLLIDCNTTNNGKFIAKLPEVYVE
jgi:hypothetical protein